LKKKNSETVSMRRRVTGSTTAVERPRQFEQNHPSNTGKKVAVIVPAERNRWGGFTLSARLEVVSPIGSLSGRTTEQGWGKVSERELKTYILRWGKQGRPRTLSSVGEKKARCLLAIGKSEGGHNVCENEILN